ncbi:transcription cofactor vestigial-like protein 2, partial [Lampetra fluviatilis]
HQQQQQRHEKERVPAAQYLTSRCLLLTYFRGDIASEVDEHFSRALSQQPPAATGTRASTPGAEQPHHPHHHLVQQQQEVAAAWHYPLSSQAGAYSRGVSDLYSAGTHPFDPLYGPLLVPPPPPPLRPARLPPALGPGCDLGKASESPVGGPWGQAGFAAHSPVEVAQSLNAEAARRYGLCSSSLMS